MQTFRSEEDYYAFVERIYFRISKNTNRCTKLLKYNSNYPDTHFSTADYHIGDWDVIFYDYLPDENYQNTLEITTLDTINNLVQGRFDLKIIKTIPSFYEEIPDTIHFVNGVFECEILD